MELRWKASFSASCVHAVLCREQGYVGVDAALADLVAEPGAQLVRTLQEVDLDVLAALQLLESLASEFDNNRQLVEAAQRRLLGSPKEHVVSLLAAAVSTLETRLLAARPEMVDELALRARPLQEQWQARGAGLLRQVGRLTAETFIAPAAEIVFVTPWVGGHGRADIRSNRVIFEGVLANPHDDLPEALRLGWLLAQLQADVPIYSEGITGGQLPHVAALAALPAILAAAEEVEWATCDEATITRALECWYPEAVSAAGKLYRWWQAYAGGGTAWTVAWRALEPLLGADG